MNMNLNMNTGKADNNGYDSPAIADDKCGGEFNSGPPLINFETLVSAASQIIATTKDQIFLRDCDRLLILRPNRMYFVNKTALYILNKLYNPRYHKSEEGGKNFTIDLNLIIDECAAKYKIDKPVITADIRKLLQTLASLLASQSSVPYVDRHPTPQLKITHFGSHELYYPVLSEIALTYNCQLKCSFCYAGIGSCKNPRLDLKNKKTEMSADEIKKTIDIICDTAHCPTISFTGGEPTLRFGELSEGVRHAKSKNMRVNLITNGIVLSNNSRAEEIKEAGLDSAQVSIEGSDAGTHDSITGVKGSFDKSIAAVKNLKAAGIHVHTNSTLTSDNYESVYGVAKLISELRLKYFSVNMVIKTGNANINENLLINYTNIGRHIDILQKEAQANGVKLVWYSPTPYCLFNPVAAGLGSKSCAAASGLFSVSPYGEVLPCSSFKDSLGNILDTPFDTIWSSRAARYFRNKEFMPPVCSHCDKKDICQGACPLYWDACGNFKEIEKIRGAKLSVNLKNIAWKVKRRFSAPKYGI
jgi:radical SAM protein with 4Fe4S-binding SPASM domain